MRSTFLMPRQQFLLSLIVFSMLVCLNWTDAQRFHPSCHRDIIYTRDANANTINLTPRIRDPLTKLQEAFDEARDMAISAQDTQRRSDSNLGNIWIEDFNIQRHRMIMYNLLNYDTDLDLYRCKGTKSRYFPVELMRFHSRYRCARSISSNARRPYVQIDSLWRRSSPNR